MRHLATFVLIILTGASVPVLAQRPGPGAAPMRGAGPGVEMFLSQTGTLQLTDQQVVRLAAIARRAEERRRALRTRLERVMSMGPGDGMMRRGDGREGGPGAPRDGARPPMRQPGVDR